MIKREMPELKPCPFCGTTPQSFPCSGGVGIECPICDIVLLDERWNARADLPPTPAEAMRCPEVAAMSAALRQIRETLPHVEVMRDADREIVNDLIRQADAALAPAEREG